MKTLFLLCGMAFSGKTTMAQALVDRRGLGRISLDEINRERGVGYGGGGLPGEVWKETHETALTRLEEMIATGRDIVVDDTSCFRWLRESYRRVAERHRYRTRVLFLDVPLEEVEERRRVNERRPARGSIEEAVFESHVLGFEYPQSDEEVLVYRPNERLETWIDQHFPND